MRSKCWRKNTWSGVLGPMTSSLIWESCDMRIMWPKKSRKWWKMMLGYFDYTALREKKQQEVKKGSLSFQVFLPNFLLFTEKIYAQIEKKSMLSRSVNVSVTIQASRPTIVSPSLWPIKVHGNNQENIPPQSVRNKAKLGHLLTHPHFIQISAKKQRNYCLLWAHGWVLSKQSENEREIIWSTCLFYRWE